MSTEERFLEAIEDEEDEEETTTPDWRERQRQRLQRKNRGQIDRFLGRGKLINESAILPRYYGDLLTWALHQYLEREDWKIARTLGYRGPEPIYTKVNTGTKEENLLMDGQILVEKGDDRFIVTVDINPRWRGSLQLEGPAGKKEEMVGFLTSVLTISEKENIYKGRKIEFDGKIRFLDIKDRSWDDIVLDGDIKSDIKANTTDFLRRGKEWEKYGIPLKRGILLAGEPGTGKTIICKALMTEADGLTCITTSGYALDVDEYITELYELAHDLSPSIVFIEDIDLIGQSRMEFGYHRGPALLSLLSVMDGVEEQEEIVTVATTNCLEMLDKALSERPSRFDRVIKLTRPSLEQRRELISSLSGKIPIDDGIQEYIADKTDNCTPAQIQEIVYSLVIQCPVSYTKPTLSKNEIDNAISRINGGNRHRLGFNHNGNHNGKRPNCIGIQKVIY